jgi:hypothetical protein
MASVRLDFEDVDDDALPDLCMKCAAPATIRVRRTFAWTPSWVIVLIVCVTLPGIIVALVLTKRKRVTVPLCEQHKNHWSWRLWVGLIGFGVVLLPFAAGFVSNSLGPSAGDVTPWLFLSAFFAFLVWLIFMLVLQAGVIRPAEIGDYTITLQNVSRGFADAYRDERRGYPPARYGDDFRRPAPGRDRPRRPDLPPDAIERG